MANMDEGESEQDSAESVEHVPRVTVFTPSHDPKYLDQCLKSLLAQTFIDWEWVVVLNQKARWWDTSKDPRVRVMKRGELEGVGAAKRYACAQARGEILVEFDHDDDHAVGRQDPDFLPIVVNHDDDGTDA